MIVTTLDQLPGQIPPAPNIRRAISFIQQFVQQDLPQGRVEVDGDRVYALVQRYDSIPTTGILRLEAHRKYIDFQYIASGEEVIGYAPLNHLSDLTDYDEKKDILFGQLPADQATPILLKAGMLGVFYPKDAHAPKLARQAASPVVKVVVKVAVE